MFDDFLLSPDVQHVDNIEFHDHFDDSEGPRSKKGQR